MKNKIKQLTVIMLLNGLAITLFPAVAFSAMTSTNYTIYADSIGLDGGSLSTSTSYSLQDTVGESPAGQTTSTSYTLTGGYQAMERGLLSVEISNSNLNLGSLNSGAVSQATTVVTVSSDSTTGYTLSVGSVSGGMPAPVAAGHTVTAGVEGYGVSASGSDAQFSGDAAVANGLTIASASEPATKATTLTFKAAMSNGSQAGTYSQSITLSAVANF